jgi:hypothetical protein
MHTHVYAVKVGLKLLLNMKDRSNVRDSRSVPRDIRYVFQIISRYPEVSYPGRLSSSASGTSVSLCSVTRRGTSNFLSSLGRRHNTIKRRVQVTKLRIMKFSPVSYHIIHFLYSEMYVLIIIFTNTKRGAGIYYYY